MSIIKLKNAGEEATLAIAAAEIEQGQYGEQVKFTTADGDVMWVPIGSVVRQLDRVGVADIPDLAGLNVHFSRAASNKPGAAPYWNLDKAREGDTVKKPNGAKPKDEPYESPGRLPGEDPLESTGFDELVRKYTECVSEAVGLAQRINKAGIAVDGSAVSSMAETLMIARGNARV